MFGILMSIFNLGVRAIGGIHDHIDNMETINRTTQTLSNGRTMYMDNECRFYIDGEQVYHDGFTDENGKYHEIEVGFKSKKIYRDLFEEECKKYEKQNEENKQKAIKKGMKAYVAYHPRTPCIKPKTTEISTGKIIYALTRARNGKSTKEYAAPQKKDGYISDILDGTGVKIPITSEEFDALNDIMGSHYVSDDYRCIYEYYR